MSSSALWALLQYFVQNRFGERSKCRMLEPYFLYFSPTLVLSILQFKQIHWKCFLSDKYFFFKSYGKKCIVFLISICHCPRQRSKWLRQVIYYIGVSAARFICLNKLWSALSIECRALLFYKFILALENVFKFIVVMLPMKFTVNGEPTSMRMC